MLRARLTLPLRLQRTITAAGHTVGPIGQAPAPTHATHKETHTTINNARHDTRTLHTHAILYRDGDRASSR